MTDLEKAARQALDALEAALDESVASNHVSCRAILTAQIDALRAALAQQAEPVAWMVNVSVQNWQGQSEYRTMLAFRPDPIFIGGYAVNEVANARPLIYGDAAPPAKQAEPVVEPVFEIGFGWLVAGDKYPRGTKLYAALAQQQAEPVDKALTNAESQVDKEQAEPVADSGNPSY